MNKTRIHIFISSFLVIFFLLHALLVWLGNRQAKLYQDEIKILHDEVEHRFVSLIENNSSILLVSSAIATQSMDFNRTYEDIAKKILLNFNEILGLIYLDSKGVLTKAAPFEKNARGIGKRTQNYEALLISLEKGEKLFVSPPFDLYQGIKGISFYVPLFDGSNFHGWLALTQGLDRFMEKFEDSKFLDTYHLIILDAETGRPYYTTASAPQRADNITKNKVNIKGREIHFISWRRAQFIENFISWPTLVFLSLLLSLVVYFAYWSLEQRLRSKKELENIEVLLRATFNSTSRNLSTIQEQLELVKLGSGFVPIVKISTHLAYINSLIEQLRVLVRISESKDSNKLDRTTILPMLVDLSRIHAGKLRSKELRLSFAPEDFFGIEILTSYWSLCHDTFECLIDYFIDQSEVGDEILISPQVDDQQTIVFQNILRKHNRGILSGGELPKNLLKASETIEAMKGRMILENQSEHGAIATVTLPVLLPMKGFSQSSF